MTATRLATSEGRRSRGLLDALEELAPGLAARSGRSRDHGAARRRGAGPPLVRCAPLSRRMVATMARPRTPTPSFDGAQARAAGTRGGRSCRSPRRAAQRTGVPRSSRRRQTARAHDGRARRASRASGARTASRGRPRRGTGPTGAVRARGAHARAGHGERDGAPRGGRASRCRCAPRRPVATEPDVARRLDQLAPAGELRHHTDPGGVVVGAGARRRRSECRRGPSRSGGQDRGVPGHADLTLRERPCPGTRNCCTDRRGGRARRKARLIGRVGAAPNTRGSPAGRGCRSPQMRMAPRWARRAGDRAAARTANASAVAIQSAVPRARLGLGHRRLAGEVLADVGGGPAVDGVAALEQRHAVGLAAGEHEVGAERGAHHALERRAARRPRAPPP